MACGGGGGGGGGTSNASTTIGGTAATGSPIIGGTVQIQCASGTNPSNTTTSGAGVWTVTVTGNQLPCAVQVSGGTVNSAPNVATYTSIATAGGTVNITPLTDLIVANLTGASNTNTWFTALATSNSALASITPTQVAAAVTKLQTALNTLSGIASTNPISAALTAASGNAIDDSLVALANGLASASSSYGTLLTSAASANFTSQSATLLNALAAAYAQTVSGGYVAGNLVTTAPASSGYTPGSEQDQAFNLLNSERNSCGFGYLTHNANLDTAAQAYVNWFIVNYFTDNHIEAATFPSGANQGQATTGFTGVNYYNRTAAAGYNQTNPSALGEIGAPVWYSTNIAGTGITGMRALLASPYHLKEAIGPFRDIGLTVTSGGPQGSGAAIIGPVGTQVSTYLWIDLGYQSNATPQLANSATLQTYPCQGTTGTAYALFGEEPNPVPGRDLSVNPIGQPVFIQIRPGHSLVVTSITMTQTSNGASVNLLPTVTAANDTNGMLSPNMAFAMPNSPLLQNTQYSVSVQYTDNGIAFSKTFTFTTGAVAG